MGASALIALIALMWMLARGAHPGSGPRAITGDWTPTATSAPAVSTAQTSLHPVLDQPVIPPANPVAPANHAEFVGARLAELMALAMNDDANSVEEIISELSNPDPQIRRGAVEAVVQFGDRSVIPRLQAIAEQTDNEADRADILEAAEFLNLPRLTDDPPPRTRTGKSSGPVHTNRPGNNPFRREPAQPVPPA